MTPEVLESLLQGARETDAVEFKGPMIWDPKALVKDILAMANIVDGGAIIIGVEEGETFERRGLTEEQIASYKSDVMRDQIAPYADPRVIFSRQVLDDATGLHYVVIEVEPFEEIPVICAKGGPDVDEGVIYYRSRARRPESARVARSEDMREIVESAIVRRSRQLQRIGFAPESGADLQQAFDQELDGL
jgi:predicted HTH transcriptional regulator